MKAGFFEGFFATDNEPLTLNEKLDLGQRWKRFLASGFVMILLGFVTVFFNASTTESLNRGLASILFTLSLLLGLQAFDIRHDRGAGVRLLHCLVAFSLSVLMFRYPYSGMIGVSLVLSFYFLSSSALKWAFFSVVRIDGTWNWGAASATFTLFLFFISMIPYSAFWIPQALLGAELFLSGAGMIGFSLSLHRNMKTLFSKTKPLSGSDDSPLARKYKSNRPIPMRR